MKQSEKKIDSENNMSVHIKLNMYTYSIQNTMDNELISPHFSSSMLKSICQQKLKQTKTDKKKSTRICISFIRSTQDTRPTLYFACT